MALVEAKGIRKTGFPTTVEFQLNVGANAGRRIIGFVGHASGASAPDITSVTYAGSSTGVTLAPSALSSTNFGSEKWRWFHIDVSSATGSNELLATTTSNANSGLVLIAAAYDDISGVSAVAYSDPAVFDTNPRATVASAVGEVVVGLFFSQHLLADVLTAAAPASLITGLNPGTSTDAWGLTEAGAAGNVTIDGTISANRTYVGAAFSMAVGAGGGGSPSISSTSSATPGKGATLTVSGSNFGAAQGTQQLRIGGAVQPIQAWSASSIVVAAVDRGLNKYGVPVNVEIWDGTLQSNSYALTSLQPQAGWSFVNIAALGGTGLLSFSPALAVGDQVAWRNWGGAVAVASDGVPVAEPWVGEFEVEAWTPGDGWGPVALQIIDLGTPNPRLLEHLFDNGLFTDSASAAEVQLWEAFGPFGATEPALVLLDGVWRFDAAAGPSQRKLYVDSAGVLRARTSPVTGERLLALAGGLIQAGAANP